MHNNKHNKLLLIYNPNSGGKTFKNSLDDIIRIAQNNNVDLKILRTSTFEDLDASIRDLDDDYKYVIVSGGDGTFNVIINTIKKYNKDIVLGIIPGGTANDFATYLGLSNAKYADDNFESLLNGKIIRCDVSKVNDRYFINVCAGGLFANISSLIEKEVKDTFGKSAYYLRGFAHFMTFKSAKIKVKTRDTEFVDDFYFFLLLNTEGTGGFENICDKARISDGYLDFVGVKKMPMASIAKVMIDFLKGNLLDHERIVHIKSDYFEIEPVEKSDIYEHCDIDGEIGPQFPIKVEVEKHAIQLLVPLDFDKEDTLTETI